MAWEMVQIKSWKHYWNDYVVKGLQDGLSTTEIHGRIVEEMRKEVFGQLMFRAKVSDISELEDNDVNGGILESIRNTTRQKFNALMRECRKFKETRDILNEADFRKLSPFPDEELETEEAEEEVREENIDDSEGT